MKTSAKRKIPSDKTHRGNVSSVMVMYVKMSNSIFFTRQHFDVFVTVLLKTPSLHCIKCERNIRHENYTYPKKVNLNSEVVNKAVKCRGVCIDRLLLLVKSSCMLFLPLNIF